MTQPPIRGWKLDPADRADLLARFAPRYARTVADHVTFARGEDGPAMPDADEAVIIGQADDGEGVQALVVEIAGTHVRPAGGTYHVTWSLAEGREARESNDVIAARGWTPIEGRPTAKLREDRWQ